MEPSQLTEGGCLPGLAAHLLEAMVAMAAILPSTVGMSPQLAAVMVITEGLASAVPVVEIVIAVLAAAVPLPSTGAM